MATVADVSGRFAEVRPLLVVITGEPGSGKSSLGRSLSAALRLPFLSRDDVRGGLLATAGLWNDQLHAAPPRETAVDTCVAIIEAMARLGVTSIVELLVTAERAGAFRRLEQVADVVVIRTEATDAAERAHRRDHDDPLLNRSDVLSALGCTSIEDHIDDPRRALLGAQAQADLDGPLLRVRTDQGYDPPLDDIVDWIIDRARR